MSICKSLRRLGLVLLLIGVPALAAETVKIKIDAVSGLRFDPARFAVEPGQMVELTVSNADTMLHNLLVVEPGAREEIVKLAMDLVAEGTANRDYVPESDKVILHFRVLSAGESQTWVFEAPEIEGVYPYVCTFPGHGTVMYGAMHVTRYPMPPVGQDFDLPDQIRLADPDSAPPAHAHSGPGKDGAEEAPRPDMLEHLQVPDGFGAVIFAQPPEVNYPTSLASSADGRVVFVGVDRNSSLGRDEGQGAIIRAEDTSGDGRADSFSTFAEVDSPRGVVWDGDALYVLHPPDITRFRDTTGDGVADERKVLVAGIGYGYEHPRGADHTTNGLRMGIDGWLYIAVGDFGFAKAVGTDGIELQLLGGGIARVRPDGSELELVATGFRNIYDAAISPTLDLFARDNDNDGDGWDTRLFHVIPTAEYGYPRHFTNFSDEILSPMARYGSGSPTGAYFLDEPGWPEEFNRTLFTAEWNRDRLDRHVLSADGTGFQEEARESFFGIPSPTGIVSDGRSNLYVASWYRGGFKFGGPNVGFVARLTPSGYDAPESDDFAQMDDGSLLTQLASSSDARRRFAQREILRRGENADLVRGLENLAKRESGGVAARVAAIFTLKQLRGTESHEVLLGLLPDETIREFALRALADRIGQLDRLPSGPFLAGLADDNPRVRLQSVIGLGRLGRVENAGALVRRLRDEDPAVAHAAEKALVRVEGFAAAFAAFDAGDEFLEPARRVLQAMHRDAVVDGLLKRLSADQAEPVRQATLVALARLHFEEWTGWSQRDWWRTQPDRRGPYYFPTAWERTPDIGRELRRVLESAAGAEAGWLRNQMERHRIAVEEDGQ